MPQTMKTLSNHGQPKSEPGNFHRGIHYYSDCNAVICLYCLTPKKQTTKFSSANLKKNVKSKLYYIENSKTRGQTV